MAKSAKPERGEKSQAVREYFKAHPKAKVKEVTEALGANGMTVSQALVAAIKYKDRSSRGRARRKGAMSAAAGNGVGLNIDHLLAAKKFALSLGGIENAQAALAAFAKLH